MRFSIFTGAALALAYSSAALAGTIYVVDDSAGDVYSYSSTGVRSVFSTQVGFSDIGAAFNSSGTLFAAARDSGAIDEYSPTGVESVFASVASPYGLAVNSAGDVFTGASFGLNIIEFTPSGTASVFATGQQVYSLAFDSHGDLFEGSNGTIDEFAPNGTETTFATGTGAVFGLTFDGTGNLYAGSWNNEILKFTPGGTESVFASFSTNYLPTGLAYDYGSGNIFMSEVQSGESLAGQQSIFEFTPAGAMSTFATGLYTPYALADLQQIPASTPEPGSLYLIGGGIALIALRRLRVRSAGIGL